EEPGVVAVYLATRPSKAADHSVRIGGSVYHKDDTLQGAIGSANEFGHTSVARTDFDQDTCNCGNPKCLETFVNRKLGEQNNEPAMDDIAEALSDKLRDLIFFYNPSLLVVDLLAFPRMVKLVMDELDDFIELRQEQLSTNGPEVVTPGDSEMACARGACIKSYRNLALNPEKYAHLSLH
ncbi:MAG: ROK family protein, partial [Candidatus Bipolaricaulota bacterium]